MVLSWRTVALLAALQVCASVPETLYHNHFAVHVPAGGKRVDDIADRHGFVNHGQVCQFATCLESRVFRTVARIYLMSKNIRFFLPDRSIQ